MEKPETNQIAVFSPELQNTPGWAALARDKQDWLLEHTSNILQYRRMEGLSAVAACRELAEIETTLSGESLTMTNYIRSVFGASERTAWRRLADFKELRKHWSDHMIDMVASKGATLLKGASGIHMGALVNVAKLAPPPPKGKEERIIEAYISKDLREAIRASRSDRRTGKTIKITGEDAARIAFNGIIRVMKGVKLPTSSEKRKWLQTVVGWVMEYNAIPGAMRVGKITIPDGMVAKVGRPRGSTKKKKAQ